MENLIIKKNGEEIEITAEMLDADGDEINCTFNYDGCVCIDTKQLSFIELSIQNLQDLINLVERAEKEFDEHFKQNP
jgi:RNAse (barnase) inhibitor barstar